MQEYVVNRPDEGVMNRVLQENFFNATGVILRLAWQAGLLRDEIQHLTWAQINFLDQTIVLSDRTVPVTEEMAHWLTELRSSRNRCSEIVVLSDRDQKPLTAQSISRLARMALDKAGQTSVRLIDLRHDYILRLLETHDWQYVSRVTGVEAAALNIHFAEHLEQKKVSTRVSREKSAQIDEFTLWKLLQAEKGTPAGVALWLTWQMGLRVEEITTLTWQQVDFERECLYLPERTLPMTSGVMSALQELRAATSGDGHVLTTPRSGRPYDRTRLSRVVRAVLIRGGMDDVTLRDLRLDCDIRVGGENQVLAYVRQNQSVTRGDVMRLLGLSKSASYHRLKQMVNRGKLVQIGSRYYLRDTVVPPELQETVILDYLTNEGFAYRQDIARILRIEVSQCRPILQRLIDAGKIQQDRQRYILKKETVKEA